MDNEILIIGSGLVGSVIARYFAEEQNKKVVIWEKRNHIGGNLYDYVDDNGIRVHKYGPHIFHTENEKIYNYICKYGKWESYNLVCGAVIDGICTPTAFNFNTIDSFYAQDEADELKKRIREKFEGRESATVLELLECNDMMIKEYAQFLYDKDYSLYTAKQWGISPDKIDKSIFKRVPIRFTYEKAYFKDRYQVMPAQGYTEFISNILKHKNITVILNKDALKHMKINSDNKILVDNIPIQTPVIYTGPVDELFGLRYGRLPYRSLRFEWKYEEKDSFQEMPVVAYPQEKDFTRITEYKKLPIQNVKGTTYAIEYPLLYDNGKEGMEPYYPVITDESKLLFEKYQKNIKKVESLYCCGRLADFKYYDMDKAIESAFNFIDNFNNK